MELLPSPVFSDALRSGAVPGVMESQLVSHPTRQWCCYLALSTVISFFNLRHLQDSKHIFELFRVGGLEVKAEPSFVLYFWFVCLSVLAGRNRAFGLQKRETGRLENKQS